MNETLSRRNTNTSFIALLKEAFASVLRKEKLTVSLENSQDFKRSFDKMTRQLSEIGNSLNRLRDEGIHMPETAFELDNGADKLEEKIDKLTEAITHLSSTLKSDVLTEKEK